MYFGDSRPQDEAVDDAMGAIYQQLDGHVSDADIPYDVEAGLDRLTERMHRELGEVRLPAAAAVSGSSVAKSDAVLLAEIEVQAQLSERAASLDAERSLRVIDADLRLALANGRRSYVMFGGIAVVALASVALLVLGRLPSTAAISAVAAVNGVVAAAGAFIQRGAVAVRQRAAASLRPERSSARQHRGGPEERDGAILRIEQMRGGSIEIGEGIARRYSDPRPAALHHRAMTILLTGLTVAVVAAFAVSVAGIMAQGSLSPYEIGLLVPGGTSILLLITSWWWRVMDRSDPGREASRLAGGPRSSDRSSDSLPS